MLRYSSRPRRYLSPWCSWSSRWWRMTFHHLRGVTKACRSGWSPSRSKISSLQPVIFGNHMSGLAVPGSGSSKSTCGNPDIPSVGGIRIRNVIPSYTMYMPSCSASSISSRCFFQLYSILKKVSFRWLKYTYIQMKISEKNKGSKIWKKMWVQFERFGTDFWNDSWWDQFKNDVKRCVGWCGNTSG